MTNISNEIINKLREARNLLELHNEFDWEITVSGNGYSAFEAIGGLKMAFNALGLEWPNEAEITDDERRQFIIDNGEEPEDYDL